MHRLNNYYLIPICKNLCYETCTTKLIMQPKSRMQERLFKCNLRICTIHDSRENYDASKYVEIHKNSSRTCDVIYQGDAIFTKLQHYDANSIIHT